MKALSQWTVSWAGCFQKSPRFIWHKWHKSCRRTSTWLRFKSYSARPASWSKPIAVDSITDTAPCRSLTKTIGSWSFWKAPTLPRAWQQGMMLRDAQRRQVMPSNISMIINVPLILWSCCPYSYWLCLPWQQKPPQPRAEKTLQRALGKWAPSVGASGKSLWTKIHKSANQLKLVLKFEKAQTFDLFQIIKIWRMCCAH